MLFGTAKEIITPVRPMRIACTGDFEHPFSAIHDDVYVRALVLEEAGKRMGFMCFDLLFHDRGLNEALEAYAGDAYGFGPGALVITYTHAHTAPAARGYFSEAHDADYEMFLLERARACLDRAMCALMPGTLEWGTFECDHNISRRGKVNGKFAIAPNFDYQHDRQFVMLCVRDEKNALRALLMNYACHPVFYPALDQISGEFPARLCQVLDAKYPGCVSMYCQSVAGDVRPRPTAQPNADGTYAFRSLDFEAVDAFAAALCDDVVKHLGSCRPVENLHFGSADFDIDLPLNPMPLDYFERMAAEFADQPVCPVRSNAIFIANGGYDGLSESLMLHGQLIRLCDDLWVATVGGEPCYGVKKAVLQALPGKQVLFIGYTDACAYLVDDAVLEEGGYEPDSFVEYRLKGPLKKGVTALYTQGFLAAREAIQ